MKKYKNELRLLLLMAFVALLALPLYRMMRGGGEKKYYLLVNDVTGMSEKGAPVLYKGLEVGQTVSAEFMGDSIVVCFILTKNVRLPKPARPVLVGSALGISSSVIKIEADTAAAAYYKPGDTLYNLRFVQRDSALLHKIDSFGNALIRSLNNAAIRPKPADSLK